MSYTYSVVTGSDVEDGLKGQPDDTGGVHGEANELGFVEILWTLPGLEGIEGAEDDEDAVVGEGHQHARVQAVAFQSHHISPIWTNLFPHSWCLNQQPDKSNQQLGGDQCGTNCYLRGRAYKAWSSGTVPCPSKDPSDPVGLRQQSWIANSKGGAKAKTSQGAHKRWRFGNVNEGHGIAQEYT